MQRLPHSAIRTRAKIEIDSKNFLFVVSPSGKKLAVFEGKQILIIDLNTNRILANIPIQYLVGSFDFSESESYFFVEEKSGKFYEMFSAENEFEFLRREKIEDFTSSILFWPRLNLICVRDYNKNVLELFSIYPKTSLNFLIDFSTHRHKIDELSESFIFRYPFQERIEVVDLKNLTSHIVDDSIDARFFALTSDKKTFFIHNFHRIQLIDFKKHFILRDFHIGRMMVLLSWAVIRPRCLIQFSYENNNLNQFYQLSQNNNLQIRKFQIPSQGIIKLNSFRETERRGFFKERDGEGNYLLKEVELGNICELMMTGLKNQRLVKLHMSLERRGLEIKPWKPKRYVHSQPLSSDNN